MASDVGRTLQHSRRKGLPVASDHSLLRSEPPVDPSVRLQIYTCTAKAARATESFPHSPDPAKICPDLASSSPAVLSSLADFP